MGARELVVVAIGLLAIYLAYVLLKLARLSRKPKVKPREREAQPEYHTVLDLSPLPREEPRPAPVVAPPTVMPGLAPSVEAPAVDAHAAREHFDAAFELARVRRQLTQLQEGHDRLEAEIGTLREELDVLRAARNVSPQYGEAVLLAQRGLGGDAIAERCGISVSEAELVAALARGNRTQE
ncbi:DUF2802 domain-containing protein [Niveibacterium sp. SC-1]|uniref:DUF2802 domain-containing protein n=1 Tax=Niveibacterium sp. SC-1 TaxID=3135646 RepID=UPI00311EAD76